MNTTTTRATQKSTTKPAAARATTHDLLCLGDPCPDCGSGASEHETNGCSPSSVNYTILCTRCGRQESPNDG